VIEGTDMHLLSRIRSKAAGLGKTIILPESEEPRILKAAEVILKERIARRSSMSSGSTKAFRGRKRTE